LIRLTRRRDIYDLSAKFRLADFVDLPGQGGDELDLEGLDISNGYLWAVGSHSAVRKRVRMPQVSARHEDVTHLSPRQVTSTFEPGATTSPGAGD
jgi:hypothetical protein